MRARYFIGSNNTFPVYELPYSVDYPVGKQSHEEVCVGSVVLLVVYLVSYVVYNVVFGYLDQAVHGFLLHLLTRRADFKIVVAAPLMVNVRQIHLLTAGVEYLDMLATKIRERVQSRGNVMDTLLDAVVKFICTDVGIEAE